MVTIIRRGITRDVILLGPWAIKIPTCRYGLWSLARGVLANQSEAQWQCAEVAPLLWTFHGVISVYRRAEPVPAGYPIDDVPLIYEAPPPDKKLDNLGVLDGKVVWLDYDYSWSGLR